MATRRTLLVDAFTDEPLAGNAAGVVPDAGGLSAEQMQAIARELAVSETAFLRSTPDADRAIRYFTPTQEVDLCGHATIASHAFLGAEGVIEPGTHTLETNAGVIEVELTDGGRVWMTQNEPTVREVSLDYERVADALGIDPAALTDVGEDLPPAYASTGLPFLVLPVNFLEHLSGMAPDMDAVEAIAAEHDATGIYVFTFDALERESTLHGRMFAPGAGVPEDPVTGTASGACGAYLDRFAAFDDGDDGERGGTGGRDDTGGTPAEMIFEQGHFLDRPGFVRVRVGDAVRVGGDAVVSMDGEIEVPEYDDEEILEA